MPHIKQENSVTINIGVTGALLPSGQFTSFAVTLPTPARLGELPELIRKRLSMDRADRLTNVMLVVNDVCTQDRDTILGNDDRVLLISPISGG